MRHLTNDSLNSTTLPLLIPSRHQIDRKLTLKYPSTLLQFLKMCKKSQKTSQLQWKRYGARVLRRRLLLGALRSTSTSPTWVWVYKRAQLSRRMLFLRPLRQLYNWTDFHSLTCSTRIQIRYLSEILLLECPGTRQITSYRSLSHHLHWL